MKLKTYMLYVVSAMMLLAACNDMENVPTNKFTDNSYWTSEAKAQNVVNMAYSQMYDAGKMWSDESLSDNVIDGRTVTDQRAIRKGQATPSIGVFDSEWKNLYGGIKTCHVFLEKVDLVPNMNPAAKARMIAEIRFIRAAIYFRLVNFYGDVPFFTKDITLDEANSISRTSAATVLQFIHDELEDIKDDLPINTALSADEQGKITKGAVSMLQARVYLMEGNWDKVITYTDNLINNQGEYGTYDLYPSYRGLFEEENEYNQEVIMAEVRILGELPNDDIYDFVLLTVRENQLYEALTELKNNKRNTNVTMINSLDSYNKWEDIVGKGRILPAFPGAGGSINDDGILDAALTPRLIQPTTFAEISGNKSERTKQFSEILRHAHIPYQKVTDMHLWQLCHLAMVVPIADAYYESDDPEKVEKEWKIMRKTAERLKRNFNFLRKQKGKLSPWKMNIFCFLPLPFLAIMLAVTFGSSFGDKFMYQHAMKAPDEMRELHKQFYAYMKRMKKCGCKAKKVQ